MSHKKAYLVAVICLASAVCGCATQTAERITEGDYTTKGVRYWLSAPYLLVTDRVRIFENQTVHVQDGSQFTKVTECAALACTANQAQSGPQSGSGGITGTPVTPPPQGAGEIVVGNPKPAAESKPAGMAASSAVSVVWLPDYCEQYAYRSKTFFAKADFTLSLADGWRLESVTANQDTTAVVSKLLDLVGTRIQADAATKQARIAAAVPQSGTVLIYWIRTEASDLYPGLYPVFPRKDCKNNPEFNPKVFDIKQSISWTRVDP